MAPDGRRIVYVQKEPRQQRREVWTLPPDGSAEASRLVAVEGSLEWPALTPDGRALVAVQIIPKQAEQLVRVSLDDRNEVAALLPPTSLDSVRWLGWARVSPDGRLAETSSGNLRTRPDPPAVKTGSRPPLGASLEGTEALLFSPGALPPAGRWPPPQHRSRCLNAPPTWAAEPISTHKAHQPRIKTPMDMDYGLLLRRTGGGDDHADRPVESIPAGCDSPNVLD